MAVGRLEQFQPLLPSEEVVLGHLLSGDSDAIGDGNLPEAGQSERTVRAEFLRFLLLGGDEHCRVHEKGVRLRGALITGVLDLEGCRVHCGIALKDCRFESAPIVRSAIIDNLVLDGSTLPGLRAEVVEVRGGVSLAGAVVAGAITIHGSRLGGPLNCDGAKITSRRTAALLGDLIVARSIVMRGASMVGGISLVGAKLSSDLNVAGIDIHDPETVALKADGIDVEGDIILHSGRIEGAVEIVGGHIEGDLDCTGTRIHNPGKVALKFDRSIVKGAWFLWKGAKIDGVLNMTGATLGSIHDDRASWPGQGDLMLNRCLYDALIGGTIDAEQRLEWLARQSPGRWGEDFWPQPYEQLAHVYRTMGHEEDARRVLIAKERLQRRARRARSSNPLVHMLLAASDGVLAITVRYGRQPLLAFFWLLFFWVAGALIFGHAERYGAFKPASLVVLRSPEWVLCGFEPFEKRVLLATQQANPGRASPGQTQLDCYRSQLEAASYPRFNAWMYSLDTLFPVLEIDQKNTWRPDPSKPWGSQAIAYFYLQSVIGWALSLLAIAGFSGVVKSR
ncbi:MAG: hypothetical protein AB7E81_03155 [Hyphomicrobiaceae bacterium]